MTKKVHWWSQLFVDKQQRHHSWRGIKNWVNHAYLMLCTNNGRLQQLRLYWLDLISTLCCWFAFYKSKTTRCCRPHVWWFFVDYAWIHVDINMMLSLPPGPHTDTGMGRVGQKCHPVWGPAGKRCRGTDDKARYFVATGMQSRVTKSNNNSHTNSHIIYRYQILSIQCNTTLSNIRYSTHTHHFNLSD